MKTLTPEWDKELAKYPGATVHVSKGITYLKKENGDIKVWTPSEEWTVWFIPRPVDPFTINFDMSYTVWSASGSFLLLTTKGIPKWEYLQN